MTDGPWYVTSTGAWIYELVFRHILIRESRRLPLDLQAKKGGWLLL